MKRILPLFLLCNCLNTAVRAQEQTPKLLLAAARCLVVENFLPPSNETGLRLGYWVDASSYPGEKVLYAVDYTRPGRSEGWVFTVFLSHQRRRPVFNIQNNAKFERTKDGIQGVDFVEAPLGGTWTQSHLVAAIKRIERQPTFAVAVKDLLGRAPPSRCESYADRK